MSRTWVANASPLILLGKIDKASLLTQLCDTLVIPELVAREVQAKQDGQDVFRELTQPNIRVQSEVRVPADITAWDLGPGESQVIAHSLRIEDPRAVLDDLEARRCARTFDVPVIGTLGVVLRAKHLGLIEKAQPVLDALLKVGLYADPELIRHALARVGE